MKIKTVEEGYYLEAESKRENNVIAVLVNIIDYAKFPTELQELEGCKRYKNKDRNYLTIPPVGWIFLDNTPEAEKGIVKIEKSDAELLSDCILLKLSEMGQTERKHSNHLKESFFEEKNRLLALHSRVCSLLDE